MGMHAPTKIKSPGLKKLQFLRKLSAARTARIIAKKHSQIEDTQPPTTTSSTTSGSSSSSASTSTTSGSSSSSASTSTDSSTDLEENMGGPQRSTPKTPYARQRFKTTEEQLVQLKQEFREVSARLEHAIGDITVLRRLVYCLLTARINDRDEFLLKAIQHMPALLWSAQKLDRELDGSIEKTREELKQANRDREKRAAEEKEREASQRLIDGQAQMAMAVQQLTALTHQQAQRMQQIVLPAGTQFPPGIQLPPGVVIDGQQQQGMIHGPPAIPAMQNQAPMHENNPADMV